MHNENELWPRSWATTYQSNSNTNTFASSFVVCTSFRIDASFELQSRYRIERVRDGVIDGGFSRAHAGALARTTRRLTISDRFARFRQRRKAWKALSWTRCVTVPMPGSCCAYEVARRSRRRGGGWAWTFGGAFNVVRVAPRTRSASAHTPAPFSPHVRPTHPWH